ncbi:MAG: DUF58 domain-containing protein [Planctomycetota bacterium]|nr:DUF58 domain-containing protein [Planctomycetota bacterium]
MDHLSEHNRTPESQILRNGMIFLCILGLIYGLLFQLRLLFLSSLTVLATLFALWFYARQVSSRFRIERKLQNKALEDQFVTVRLTVKNCSFLPAFKPLVIDFFSPDKAPYHQLSGPAFMWPGAVASMSYKGVCFNKRGSYEVGPARIVATDPLGVFSSFRLLLNPTTNPLLVLPATEDLKNLAPQKNPRSRSLSFGEYSLPKPGQSLDFHGLREYRPGDPARFIHWPTSAHRNRLLIKEYDRSQPRQTLVFLDLDGAQLRGLGRHSTHEYGIRAAASFVQYSLQKGQPSGLFAFCEENIAIRPRRGLHHMPQILEALTHSRPSTKATASFWPFFQQHSQETQKSRYSILSVLVLPTIVPDSKTLFLQCQSLLDVGHSVHVHFISGHSFLPLTLTKKRPEQEFTELLTIALKLRALGVQVSIQKNAQSLQDSLAQHFFKPVIRIRPKKAVKQ